MTPLEFVTGVDQKALDYLTIVLFGPAGVGKTTAAWGAPAPALVLTTEPDRRTRFARYHHVLEGQRDIREVLVRHRDQLQEAYLYARDGNGLETVVLDTVAGGFRVALEYETGNPKAKATLPQIGDATAWLERHLRAWLELPLNVVLVCHENVVGDGEAVERFPLVSTSKTALAQRLSAAVDVVAYCGIVVGEDGSQRYVCQLLPAGGRHVKDGTGVLAQGAEPLPLELSAWVERFRAAYAPPTPEPEPKKSKTPEEVAA